MPGASKSSAGAFTFFQLSSRLSSKLIQENLQDQKDAWGILAVSIIAFHSSKASKPTSASYVKCLLVAAVLIGIFVLALSTVTSSQNLLPPV